MGWIRYLLDDADFDLGELGLETRDEPGHDFERLGRQYNAST